MQRWPLPSCTLCPLPIAFHTRGAISFRPTHPANHPARLTQLLLLFSCVHVHMQPGLLMWCCSSTVRAQGDAAARDEEGMQSKLPSMLLAGRSVLLCQKVRFCWHPVVQALSSAATSCRCTSAGGALSPASLNAHCTTPATAASRRCCPSSVALPARGNGSSSSVRPLDRAATACCTRPACCWSVRRSCTAACCPCCHWPLPGCCPAGATARTASCCRLCCAADASS